MSFRFECEITEREQVRATRIIVFRQPATRRTLMFFGLVAVVLAASLAVRLSRERQDFPFMQVVGWAGLVAGVTALYRAPHTTVRNLRTNNRAAAGPHVYEFTDAGLQLRSPGATGAVEWANINEVYEAREFLFFYVSKAWAQLLPKRVVPDEAMPALRQALKQWVGPRAHLRE